MTLQTASKQETMTGPQGEKAPDLDQYFFGRSFRDSARLSFQHYLCKEVYGHVLHPSIPRPDTECWKVADVGTGNGCWLLDIAAHEVPANWALHGFDISSAMFPVPSTLPSNVTLEVQDAFAADLPSHLVGCFDIVHVRAFGAVVKGGDPRPLINDLCRMLRPGGYLQWDEFDATTFAALLPPSPAPLHRTVEEDVPSVAAKSVSKKNSDHAVELYKDFLTQMQIDPSWVRNLPATFTESKLDVKAAHTWDAQSCTPLLRKMFTDNWMMALEVACFTMIGRGDVVGLTSAQFMELLGEIMQEVQDGVSLWVDFSITVGQKAPE